MIATQIIRDPQQLSHFYAEWKSFVGAPETPFQTPDWLLTWWGHFGSGKPHVIVLRNGDKVCGILPCFLHDWENRKQLTLIGTGMSDYLDAAIDLSLRAPVVEALRSHLLEFDDWEFCNWQDLSADSPLQNLEFASADTPCSCLTLDGSFDGFLAQRPKDLRRNLRRYRAKAEGVGRVRFEVTETSEPGLLASLIDLHAARWQKSGESGTIEANGAAGFLREAATVMSREGMLRIFTLWFRDQIVAILLGFCTPTTIFSYLSAFDPEYESFGFGRKLLEQSIQYGYAHGYRYWNFLRGTEPYKFSWGGQIIPKIRLRFSRDEFRAKWACYERARRTAISAGSSPSC